MWFNTDMNNFPYAFIYLFAYISKAFRYGAARQGTVVFTLERFTCITVSYRN